MVDGEKQYRFTVDNADLADRLFFTHNFVSITTCKKYDSNYMHDCFDLSTASLHFDKCHMSMGDFEASDKPRYMFNRRSRAKFVPGVDKPYTECVNQSKEFSAADTATIRANIVSWITEVKKQDKDPFWSLESGDEPLNPEDPSVDITLNAYKDRHNYMHEKMVLRSSNRILHLGPMIDGRVQGRVNESLVGASDWKAPVFLMLARDTGAFSNLGDTGPSSRTEYTEEKMSPAKGFVVPTDTPFMEKALLTGRLRHGKLHGPVRMFGQLSNDPKGLCTQRLNHELSFIAVFKDGVPSGYCWKGLLGGAWVVGYADENGELTGDDIAYIYPDFKTAFVGKFEKGIMVRLHTRL